MRELQELEVGQEISIDIVVNELKHIDTTGKNYSQTIVVVEDRTGRTSFPIWRDIGSVSLDLVEGHMYTLTGITTKFREEIQIKYISSKIIQDTPENRALIDPSSSRGITPENEKAFFDVIENEFEDKRYKRYAEIAFGLGEVPKGVDEEKYRERLDKFKKAWCSVFHHDNYAGGLWNHVMGLVRITLSIKKIYSPPIGRYEKISDVNWDHILLLCFIHDIEKPSEYVVDGNKCYYNPEVRMDHTINSISRLALIHNEVEEENKLTFNELEKLKYGILCHHGGYGNYEMKSSEDKIFHAIDLIDAANVDKLRLE